jgi:hypothetical protein
MARRVVGTFWSAAQDVRITPDEVEVEMARIRRAVLEVEAELEEAARPRGTADPGGWAKFLKLTVMLDSFRRREGSRRN